MSVLLPNSSGVRIAVILSTSLPLHKTPFNGVFQIADKVLALMPGL